FSASGMLRTDARIDTSKTFISLLNDSSIGALGEIFGAMEKESLEALEAEFLTGDDFFERHTEMRSRAQRHNRKVPVSGLKDAAVIRDAFEHDYRRRYGHADAKAPAEFQALH